MYRKLPTCEVCGFAAAQCGKPTAFRRVIFSRNYGEAQPRRLGFKRSRSGQAKPDRTVAAAKPRRVTCDPENIFTAKPILIAMGKLQSGLALLSTITGGWTEFFDQPSQAEEIYSRIFSDINRRYLVGYYPTNKEHNGKQRKVNVSVRDHPAYVVMGRKAYYAPGPDQ